MTSLLTIFPLGVSSGVQTLNPRTMRQCPTRINYSDTFNAPRDGGARTHYGTDIMAAEGTPIYAAKEGRVVTSTRLTGPTGRTGHGVSILSSDNLKIHYAHMRDAPLVNRGDRVNAGQQIGVVGKTGNAQNTCPHLHIHAERDGVRVNLYDELRRIQNMPGGQQNEQISRNREQDNLFNQAVQRLHGWTQSFRIKQQWWYGNPERQRIARSVRESATQNVLNAIATARAARESGYSSGSRANIDISNRIIAATTNYIQTLDNYNNALETQTRGEQLMGQMNELAAPVIALIQLGVQLPSITTTAAANALSRAADEAGERVRDEFMDEYGPYLLAIGAGVILVLLLQSKST